jgi:endonuclease-3
MARHPTGPKSSKSPADTRRIMARLSDQHPNADTELRFSNAYELLVATILSAQCTDERVNQVTPALFRRYPDARALARASSSELEPQIQSTGFFRAKSRALVAMANEIVDQHGGEIPGSMDQLVTLPGVGRKTANVVLGHALDIPGLAVDRHVLRVANRIGIARSDEPDIVEQQLCGALPPSDWTRVSDTLILHGRRICKPRPLCDRCAVRDDCDYYQTLSAPPLGVRRAAPAAGRLTQDANQRRLARKQARARAPASTPAVPSTSESRVPGRGTGKKVPKELRMAKPRRKGR